MRKSESGIRIFIWFFIAMEALFLDVNAQRPTRIFENLDHIAAVPDAYKILQDHEGYLWVATLDGVWKFDGYEFEVFRFKPRSSARITLMEDHSGRIWTAGIGTGIDITNDSKSAFTHLELALKSNRVNSMLEDYHGNIWIGGEQGVQILTENDQGVYVTNQTHPMIRFFEDIGMPYIFSFLKQDSIIWTASGEGIYRYDHQSKRIDWNQTNASFPASRVTDLELDNDHRLWIACPEEDAVFQIYREANSSFESAGTFKPLALSNMLRFCFDLNDRIWVSSYGEGIFAFNLGDQSNFIDKELDRRISYLRYIRDPVTDQVGNLWFPSDGILKFNYDRGFKSYHHNEGINQSVSAIYRDQDNLWAGYRDVGVMKIIASGNLANIYLDPGYSLSRGFSDPATSIIPVDGNWLLVGRVGGLHLLNGENGEIRDFKLNGVIRDLFKDEHEQIWVSNQTGLLQFDPEVGFTEKYILEHIPPNRHFFQTIAADTAEGCLWIATDGNGLVKFDLRTKTMENYRPDRAKPYSFPSLKVNDLVLDDQNDLWIATDIGLVKRSSGSGDMMLFDQHYGLFNEFIASVLVGPQGMLWTSTNSGLSVFDPVDLRFTNFSKADGLSNEFYYPRVRFKDHEGNLYFGGRNGIDFFQPRQIKLKEYQPKVILQSIELSDNTKLFAQNLEDGRPLVIKDAIDFLKIRYVGMHFPAPENLEYAYRIVDINEDWQEVEKDREILLSNLKIGRHVFEVRARDKYSPGIEASLAIPLSVRPPFYASRYFIVLIFLCLAMGLWWLVRYREKRILKKEQEEFELQKRIAQLELKALRSQMNPHFIFNSMNTIQDFILTNDQVGAIKYLSKFSRLVRQALNYSAQPKIPLYEEIQLVKDYLHLEQMRFPNKFEYQITIGPEVSVHSIEVPPFLIQPLVENAIQHGFKNKPTKGALTIDIQAQGQNLRVEITDDGIGRQAATQFVEKMNPNEKGKGLSIVNQRIEMLNGLNLPSEMDVIDLYHENGTSIGTKVILNLSLD